MFDFSRDIYKELLTWKKDKNNKVLEVSGACVKIGLNQEKPYK